MTDAKQTLRRIIERARHCLEQAESVLIHNENTSLAIVDLERAQDMIDLCVQDARNYARAKGDIEHRPGLKKT